MVKISKRRARNKILNELYPPEADPDDILYDQERFGAPEPPRLLIIAETKPAPDFLFFILKSDFPGVIASNWNALHALLKSLN